MLYEIWIPIAALSLGIVVAFVGRRRGVNSSSSAQNKNRTAVPASPASITLPPMRSGDVVHFLFAGEWRPATFTGATGRRKRACLRQPSDRIVWRKLRELDRGSIPSI